MMILFFIFVLFVFTVCLIKGIKRDKAGPIVNGSIQALSTLFFFFVVVLILAVIAAFAG